MEYLPAALLGELVCLAPGGPGPPGLLSAGAAQMWLSLETRTDRGKCCTFLLQVRKWERVELTLYKGSSVDLWK